MVAVRANCAVPYFGGDTMKLYYLHRSCLPLFSAKMGVENEVALIVIGQSYDEEGKPNLAGRRAARFSEALKEQTQIPVILWDESFSTQDARATRIEMGVSRKKRAGHMDELAAVMILRSYLDANKPMVE